MALAVTAGGSWRCYRYLHSSSHDVKLVEPSETQKAGVELLRKHEEQFLSAAILLIGALWGIAIVNKDSRLRRKDWPEIFMLSCSVTFFIMYFVFVNSSTELNLQLLRDVETLSRTQVPDVLGSALIASRSSATNICFFGALLCSAFTVTSLCLFRSIEK